MSERRPSPFNSPLETGIRTLSILVASYPAAHDLHRLVQYDYLTVHSEDAGGPSSLHPPLPLRSNELLVRRQIVQKGVLLMASVGFVRRETNERGFLYSATESAGAFLSNLKSEYLSDVKERAQWVIEIFDALSADQLEKIVNTLFETWTIEFQPIELPSQWGRRT